MFKEMILSVTDWGFYIWKEGISNCLFSSPAPSSYFTCGAWSPTRPSVIYLGRMDGGVEVWDFSDQSHKPSLFHSVTSAAIASMGFQSVYNESDSAVAASQLALGDVDGHLHVLSLPKNLVRPGQKEFDLMKQFFEREEASVEYFAERRAVLLELREEMEKQAQESVKDEVKGEEDYDAKVSASEAAYRRFEAEQKALLGLA